MPDIHIHRDHGLGLPAARKIAVKWAEQVEEEYGMACIYAHAEKGGDRDTLAFTRSGVKGTLTVTADQFELEAKLGFLLGAFKDKIEGEIAKNLDALLAAKKKPVKKAKSAS